MVPASPEPVRRRPPLLVSRPMSIWTRITEAIAAIVARGESLLARLRAAAAARGAASPSPSPSSASAPRWPRPTAWCTPPRSPPSARSSSIAAEDEAAAARVFNLARQDVAGFEAYAARIARMFRGRPQVLEDILEGLFHVALADGRYHEGEEEFLATVGRDLRRRPGGLRRHRGPPPRGPPRDPWAVLGLPATPTSPPPAPAGAIWSAPTTPTR